MEPDAAASEHEEAGYIDVTFRIYREDAQYVSECVELGVASCGDTIDEALEQLVDAVDLYLESLQEEGELERVFAERGVTVRSDDVAQEQRLVRLQPDEIFAARRIPLPASLT